MGSLGLRTRLTNLYDTWLWLNGYQGAAAFIVSKLPFGINDPLKVLDAGCGTGLYSIAILKRFPHAQIVALDLKQGSVEKMRRNLAQHGFANRSVVSIGDIMGDINAGEHTLDLVITGGVLEYVAIRPAIQNLTRYLRPDGYFLNSPVRDNWLGAAVGKITGFTPYSAAENIAAFTENRFELHASVQIPLRYWPICLLKNAHIFKKP